jgi:hypothetical protein
MKKSIIVAFIAILSMSVVSCASSKGGCPTTNKNFFYKNR